MLPSITRTLTFNLCISLPYYMIYKENKKQKKEENFTKLYKWEKLPLKTLLKTLLPENLLNTGYLQAKEGTREAVRRRASTHDATAWPWKRGHATASRAAPGRGSGTGGMELVQPAGFLFLVPEATDSVSKVKSYIRI